MCLPGFASTSSRQNLLVDCLVFAKAVLVCFLPNSTALADPKRT